MKVWKMPKIRLIIDKRFTRDHNFGYASPKLYGADIEKVNGYKAGLGLLGVLWETIKRQIYEDTCG
jgi:hypothetical protein